MTALPDRFRLDGKVAIVTGGGGAIGKVYARCLAEAGAAVALADLNADAAQAAAAELEADGLRAIGVRADITDRAATTAMAEEVSGALGGIDILVNNAALMAEIPMVDVLDLSAEWLERVMRVNLFGAMNCVASVKSHLVARGGGRIINQVSAGAYVPGGIYGMSKIALVSFTMGQARSLGPHGINVNALAPGLIDNEPGVKSLPADSPARAALLNAIPGQKTGPAEDLLGTLLLLASDAGRWINGQVLSVDGGWIMRL